MCDVLSKERCTLLVLRCEVCGLGGRGFLKEEEKQMEKKTGDLVNIYGLRFSSSSREFPWSFVRLHWILKSSGKVLLGN